MPSSATNKFDVSTLAVVVPVESVSPVMSRVSPGSVHLLIEVAVLPRIGSRGADGVLPAVSKVVWIWSLALETPRQITGKRRIRQEWKGVLRTAPLGLGAEILATAAEIFMVTNSQDDVRFRATNPGRNG